MAFDSYHDYLSWHTYVPGERKFFHLVLHNATAESFSRSMKHMLRQHGYWNIGWDESNFLIHKSPDDFFGGAHLSMAGSNLVVMGDCENEVAELVQDALQQAVEAFGGQQLTYLGVDPSDVLQVETENDVLPSGKASETSPAAQVAGRTQPARKRYKGPKPWERIPDHGWDRAAVKLLFDGYTDPEIAGKLHLSAKTVTNRLSALRGLYPKIVLKREEIDRQRLEELKK